MNDITSWFMDLSNSKSVGLVIFFITFVAIIIYVYGSKKRSDRFESYRDIPFLDDDDYKAKNADIAKSTDNSSSASRKPKKGGK